MEVTGLGFDKRCLLGVFIEGVGGFGLTASGAKHLGIKPGAAERVGFLPAALTDLFIIIHRLCY
jgi:hypothetical protein